MFLDDQSYTQFCGLSTFDDRKQTAFNKTCNFVDNFHEYLANFSHNPPDYITD